MINRSAVPVQLHMVRSSLLHFLVPRGKGRQNDADGQVAEEDILPAEEVNQKASQH